MRHAEPLINFRMGVSHDGIVLVTHSRSSISVLSFKPARSGSSALSLRAARSLQCGTLIMRRLAPVIRYSRCHRLAHATRHSRPARLAHGPSVLSRAGFIIAPCQALTTAHVAPNATLHAQGPAQGRAATSRRHRMSRNGTPPPPGTPARPAGCRTRRWSARGLKHREDLPLARQLTQPATPGADDAGARQLTARPLELNPDKAPMQYRAHRAAGFQPIRASLRRCAVSGT